MSRLVLFVVRLFVSRRTSSCLVALVVSRRISSYLAVPRNLVLFCTRPNSTSAPTTPRPSLRALSSSRGSLLRSWAPSLWSFCVGVASNSTVPQLSLPELLALSEARPMRLRTMPTDRVADPCAFTCTRFRPLAPTGTKFSASGPLPTRGRRCTVRGMPNHR